MKILVLSDLNWHAHLRSMTEMEVRSFEEAHLSLDRYQRVRRYWNIIQEEEADLVLFAGDLTGDGFCGHGFHYAFILLLTLLEKQQIPSFFISGNHDEPDYYQTVIDFVQDYQYTKEISNQAVQIAGLTILGINYDCSKSKRSLNKLIKTHQAGCDIILAHSQLKRRIRLFDLPSSYIFTGHYDRKLCAHRNTVFVALDNDSEAVSYAVLEKYNGQSDKVHLKIKETTQTLFRFTEDVEQLLAGNRNDVVLLNETRSLYLDKIEQAPTNQLLTDKVNYLYLKYIRGINYVRSLETMYKLKQELPLAPTDLALAEIFQLPIIDTYSISESMVKDYLGKI